MSENNDEAKIEYVEDYLSDDVIDRVEDAISKILDDEDFFTSVICWQCCASTRSPAKSLVYTGCCNDKTALKSISPQGAP